MRARARTVGLAGALLVVLASIWWVYGDGRKPVHGMSEAPCNRNGLPTSGDARDDWGQLCVFRAANARLLRKGDRPDVVMIGDSITARWPMPGPGFVNRGIGGQVSAQVLLRFQQDAIALRPKVIHILVGINDVTGIHGPHSPDMLQNNIRAMVALSRANGIPVIIGTIGPAQDVALRPQVDRRRWVPFINRWLAQYARDEGVVLADYHAVLSGNNGSMQEGLFADTVHPNARGYAAMEPVLLEAIARRGQSSD